MDDPINASFRWTADDLLVAQRVHARYSVTGRKVRRGMWTTAALALTVGIVLLVWHNPVGFFFVTMGMALLMSPLVARRMELKHYARRPDRDMQVNCEFYPDQIVTKTEASSGTIQWRMISRVVQTSKGFLLYPNDRIFHWVPTRAFHTASDKDAFVELARSRVQNYEQDGPLE